MYRWHDERKPIKKLPNWVMAIALALLVYAIQQNFIPTTSAQPAFQSAYISDTYIRHTVSPGETLYSISRHYHPDEDWRRVAHEIREVNGITPVIYPGQEIWVPEAGM